MTRTPNRLTAASIAAILAVALLFLLATGRGFGWLTPRHLPVDSAVVAKIVPHRAIYDMKLADTKDGEISAATGQLLFSWGDSCDGWTVEQRLDIDFSYNSGDGERIRSSLATWESKDGKQLRFNVRRDVNGKTKEVYQGEAGHNDDKAHYTFPADRQIALVADTLFPTAHTLTLLQAAENSDGKGNIQITRPVFDGADKNGWNEVSAFIGAPVQITPDIGSPHPELRAGRAWPVHLAFFAPDNTNHMPDYEMKMTLLESGIANDLLIDYGDFTVSATLRSLEPLPKPSC